VLLVSWLRALKTLLTFSCDETSRVYSDRLEVPPSGVELWAARLHLLVCRACRRFVRQLRFLQSASRRLPEAHAMDQTQIDAMKARIAERLSQQ
jgi:hypothetical protein